MRNSFPNASGKGVLYEMAERIQKNKEYLGEIDGLIGDGDHGMNMNKGFTAFAKRFAGSNIEFTAGLDELGMLLLNEIGGSMGPIYGTIFMAMAAAGESHEQIGLAELCTMLRAGLASLQEIVDAKVGDKTLVDTLAPALAALENARDSGHGFAEALLDMKAAAQAGRDSTKELVAKFGRSSRLGERSRGVLDAGATSCCLLLEGIADGIIALLEGEG